MYDEDKIKDSLDFVNQIRLYDSLDPEHFSDNFADSNGSSKKLYKKDGIYGSYEDYDYEKYDFVLDNNTVHNDNTADVKTGILNDIVYILICMAVSIVIAFTFTRLIAHHTIVDGNSMKNTLENEDCLIIEKFSYYFHSPERFDIVVFPYSDDVNYIKRIIGMPGEVLQIIDGYVYINNEKLTDDVYGNEIIVNPGIAVSPVTIGEGEYFVMGDNRNSSYDSRKPDVGLVKEDDIDGKAVFRLWPLDGFGMIE